MTVIDLDAVAARVPDGALVAIPPDNSLSPAALARAIARRGAKGLRLVGVPIGGYAMDLLIGAGCAAEVETSAVTLGEHGFAPCFTRAVQEGAIRVRDATCPAIHTQLQAAEKGVPFLPLRGLIGSDILAHRPDWRVIDNPFAAAGDPIVLLPALAPDIAIIHAVLADEAGNLWVGRRRELATMAHAARMTLATVEEVVSGNLLEDERLAPGVISATYVTAIARARHGAWPLAVLDRYGTDEPHLADYARMARTADGFARYLDRFVRAAPARAAE
jgi:glutaconate CoA-transferase subunit A